MVRLGRRGGKADGKPEGAWVREIEAMSNAAFGDEESRQISIFVSEYDGNGGSLGPNLVNERFLLTDPEAIQFVRDIIEPVKPWVPARAS
jgi:hypothetical protein